MNMKEHSFYRGIEGVLTKNPSKLIWYVPIIINLFIIALILWTVYSKVDVTSTARGKINPINGLYTVEPKDMGIIEAIHVKKGDKVVKGQKLLTLKQEYEVIEHDGLWNKYYMLSAKKRALNGYYDYLTTGKLIELKDDNVLQEFLNKESRLLKSKIESFELEKRSLLSKVTNAKNEKEILVQEIETLEKLLPFYEKKVDQLKILVKDGHESESLLDERRESLITKEGELQLKRSKLKKLKTDIQIANSETQQLENRTKKEVLAELRDVTTEFIQVSSDYHKIKLTLRDKTKISEVNGTVHNLTVQTEGAVVKNGDIIMEIIPDNVGLEVEAKILQNDRGHVKVGQKAKVKIDSFQFTKYGYIEGVVKVIAENPIKDETFGEVYLAQVELKEDKLKVDGRWMKLIPGMTCSVDIMTEKRTLFEYVMSPFIRYKDEALRER